MIFYFFGIEKRIGIKKLSKADLGISDTSNQTHIGLYNDVLQFLDDNAITTAMLAYGDYCKMLDCYFDRIENPDGTFRSPKIRIGEKNEVSVVSKIREFAMTDASADWYLLWSGLENKDLVFWLVNSNSNDYNVIKDLLGTNTRIITDEDKAYDRVKSLMINKINLSSIEIQKEIEIISQTGSQSKQYKPFDLEKANRHFALVGKKGEELVNEYFEKQKSLHKVDSFEWMNKSRESGLPYDFILNKEQFIDVKSTRFDFTQNIVFSNQEIGFVNQQKSDSAYSVYRVFDLAETSVNMKICTQCIPYMEKLNQNVETFNDAIIQSKTQLLGLNVAVSPRDCFGIIQGSIRL